MQEQGQPGRPSAFTVEIAEEICLRLVMGESLRKITADDHMPVMSTVLLWVVTNREGFSERYTQAREAQQHYYNDEIIEIADNGSNDWMRRTTKKGEIEVVLDREHVTRSELRIKTRQWLMERLAKKSFTAKPDAPNPAADEAELQNRPTGV